MCHGYRIYSKILLHFIRFHWYKLNNYVLLYKLSATMTEYIADRKTVFMLEIQNFCIRLNAQRMQEYVIILSVK